MIEWSPSKSSDITVVPPSGTSNSRLSFTSPDGIVSGTTVSGGGGGGADPCHMCDVAWAARIARRGLISEIKLRVRHEQPHLCVMAGVERADAEHILQI